MPLFNNNTSCNEKVIVKTVPESKTHPITLKTSNNMLQDENYFLNKPTFLNQHKKIKSSQSDLIACETHHNNLTDETLDSSIKLNYAKKNNISRSFSNIITSVRNSLRFVRSTSPMPPSASSRSSSSFTAQKKTKIKKTKSSSPNRNKIINLDAIETSIESNSKSIPNTSKKDRTSRSSDNKRNPSSERVFFSLIRFNLERKFRKNKEKITKNNVINNSLLLSPSNNNQQQQHDQYYSTTSLNNNSATINKSKDFTLMRYFHSREKVS
jgi:hypothetical protein